MSFEVTINYIGLIVHITKTITISIAQNKALSKILIQGLLYYYTNLYVYYLKI